jgi:TonB family protein
MTGSLTLDLLLGLSWSWLMTRALFFAAIAILAGGCSNPGSDFTLTAVDPNYALNVIGPNEPGVPVYELSELNAAPVPIERIAPRYPLSLRRAGQSGSATVDFLVDEHGVTRNVYCISGTDGLFGISAVRCVAQWRFRPGIKNGLRVRTHMQVPIVFTLNNN